MLTSTIRATTPNQVYKAAAITKCKDIKRCRGKGAKRVYSISYRRWIDTK